MSTIEIQNNNRIILLKLLLDLSQEESNSQENGSLKGGMGHWSLHDKLIESIINKTQIISESYDAWKLFYKSRDVLPNGERLENLAWRLMNYHSSEHPAVFFSSLSNGVKRKISSAEDDGMDGVEIINSSNTTANNTTLTSKNSITIPSTTPSSSSGPNPTYLPKFSSPISTTTNGMGTPKSSMLNKIPLLSSSVSFFLFFLNK